MDRDEICRIGDGKKVHQVEYIPDEQLMIVLAGKQRQMRLIPVKALDQPTDTEWIKVADTKNCLTFATGVMRGGQGGKFFCLKILSLANVFVIGIYASISNESRSAFYMAKNDSEVANLGIWIGLLKFRYSEKATKI